MKEDLTLEYARRLADAAEHLLENCRASQHAADCVHVNRADAELLRKSVQALRTQDKP
jgi:hypothetical protein